jgi:hypothetical protein
MSTLAQGCRPGWSHTTLKEAIRHSAQKVGHLVVADSAVISGSLVVDLRKGESSMLSWDGTLPRLAHWCFEHRVHFMQTCPSSEQRWWGMSPLELLSISPALEIESKFALRWISHCKVQVNRIGWKSSNLIHEFDFSSSKRNLWLRMFASAKLIPFDRNTFYMLIFSHDSRFIPFH